MWGNAGSGGSRTASLGDALASCAAHASEKKKAGPDLPVLAYANRATTGNRVRACFVGYGTAGCATPAGVLHARSHSFACTQKRGPSVDSRDSTGAERLIFYRFWKKATPRGNNPRGAFVYLRSEPQSCARPAPKGALSRAVVVIGTGHAFCAGTAHAMSFRSRPGRRTGFSLSRPRTRVVDSMRPVLR